jgi:hypothetical protein
MIVLQLLESRGFAHLQFHFFGAEHRNMFTIHGQKISLVGNDSKVSRKPHDAPAAIATHAAAIAIRIEIIHLKIVVGVGIEQDDPVCADAESAVADGRKPTIFIAREQLFPVVNEDEVVACAVVFIEWYFHVLQNYEMSPRRKIWFLHGSDLGLDGTFR